MPEISEQNSSLGFRYIAFKADRPIISRLSCLCINEVYPRIYLDSQIGLAMLMTHSAVHLKLSDNTNKLVHAAADTLAIPILPLKASRLRVTTENVIDIEPDHCYYLNAEYAAGDMEARRDSDKPGTDYSVDGPPNLVIESGMTPLDRIKELRYQSMGVSEHWRVDMTSISNYDFNVTFKYLTENDVPAIEQSNVLPGMTPERLV